MSFRFCFSAGLLLPSCHAHSLSRETRICTYGHTAPTALRTDYTRFTHKHKTYGTVRTTPRLPPAPSPPYFCIFMQNGLHRCISIHRQPRENRVFAAAGTVGRKYASFTHHHIICCKSTNYTIMILNAPSRSCETGFPASR